MLESELTTLKKRFQKAAGTLTKQRQAAAGALASAVTERLTQLGMTGAELSIQLNTRPEESIHPNGHEDIEFLISTNPDQPHRPLARIASGGELSRISLAIQVVTANTSRVPTLVFDEVDAGISGAIAEVVGCTGPWSRRSGADYLRHAPATGRGPGTPSFTGIKIFGIWQDNYQGHTSERKIKD